MHGSHSQRNIIVQDISRTFPGQNYHFPGQSIQDFKVINQDMREKACYTDWIHDWLLIIDIVTGSSSRHLAVWSTNFYLNFNQHGLSTLYIPVLLFFYNRSLLYRHYIYSLFVFLISGIFHGQYFFRDMSYFCKFKYISRIWKMNLLFSRVSWKPGNPDTT